MAGDGDSLLSESPEAKTLLYNRKLTHLSSGGGGVFIKKRSAGMAGANWGTELATKEIILWEAI